MSENEKMRILVVDDEADLREILQCNLENAGYAVDTAASAEEALEILSPGHDLILLDVMMGGMSGFKMAEHLRKEAGNSTPIVFLTAKGGENDLLTGFSTGADDYIAKPFSLQEVLVRIKAVLRRTRAAGKQQKNLCIDTLCIDFGRKSVLIEGEEVHLSRKEFGILALLAGQAGKIFSREEILTEVWQGESCVLDRTVDVHIARVRRKLGKYGNCITNRQGYGYCFTLKNE